MRNLFVMAVAASLMVLGGCSGVERIGSLGETGIEAFDIRAEHAGSPSWSAGVLTWLNTKGERMVATIAPSSDPGLTAQVFQAGSRLGSAYLWGSSFDPRPDTYTDSSTTTTVSGAASASKAGASAKAGAKAGALAVNAPKTRITNNNNAEGGDGGNGGRGGGGGDGGAGGSGGAGGEHPHGGPPGQHPDGPPGRRGDD